MQAASSCPGPRASAPAVTRPSLSAEDEVDMLNDAHGSEERISVPSCYGGIGAPVSRQGECRCPKGPESPAAGRTPPLLLPAGSEAAASAPG